MACPKCATRVVVPAGEAAVTRFEQTDVERSLKALEPVPGGIFSESSFEIPLPPADVPLAAREDLLTLPWWSVYALIAGMAIVAIASFCLGAWWVSSGPAS